MQGSAISREKLATVADELSLGVALESFVHLSHLELLHWLYSATGLVTDVHPREDMAWTLASQIMGIAVPDIKLDDVETGLAIQKSFLDFFAAVPFSLVIKQLTFAGEWRNEDYSDYAIRATQDHERHRGDFKTFQEAFAIESAGGIESYLIDIGNMLVHLYQKIHPNGDPPNEAQILESSKMLGNMLRVGISEGKFGKELPFVHIGAGLHALVRYRKEPVRKGDIYDFMHARTALPYCSYFLTEKRLGNLLTDRLLRYDAVYNCKVHWKMDEIVEEMEGLVGEANPAEPAKAPD